MSTNLGKTSSTTSSTANKKKIKENDLHDQFYDPPQWPRKYWPSLFILFFILGLVFNFPLRTILEGQVRTLIKNNAPCDLQYESLKVEFFLFPKVVIKKLRVPPACTNLSNDIIVKELALATRFIGLYPIGPKFNFKMFLNKSYVESTLVLGPKEINLFIDNDTSLQSKDLMLFSDSIPKLAGQFSLEGSLALNYKYKLQALTLSVLSQDFAVPAQNFFNVDVPSLPLNNFALILDQEGKNTVLVKELKLGNEKTSIFASFKGPITLNANNLLESNLDLQGEVKLSPEFLESFSILKLLLKKYTESEGAYQMKLGGTLSAPSPMPL